MPRRRQHPHTYDITPAIQPSPAKTNFLSALGDNLPATFIVSAVVGLAVWYGSTNTERSQSNKEVEVLKTGLSELSKTIVATSKEQDERRAALGKEFLSSNKEVSTKVSDLATAIAVQQVQAKATADAMVKISEQLQQLNAGGIVGRAKR